MRLFTYWRSTASYRVRIALVLKGVTVEQVPVHLVRGGGEQHGAAYRAINPQGRVPALELDDGTVLVQSPAILDYLDEAYPDPPLLPGGAVARAKARGIADIIGCDIHPLNNVAVLTHLRRQLGQGEVAVSEWIARWILDGFHAVEALIGDDGFCLGPAPGLADVFLVPQVYSARRFNVSLDAFPRILRVDALAAHHPAFQAAHPAAQPDAE